MSSTAGYMRQRRRDNPYQAAYDSWQRRTYRRAVQALIEAHRAELEALTAAERERDLPPEKPAERQRGSRGNWDSNGM